MNFASFKNARVVRSSWLEEGGRRLDCNPYMSGALEARDALRRLSVKKEKLSEVTTRIFHAGREGRQWVDDQRYGVPFLGSSSILSADLSHLPLMSKKQIQRNPLLTLGEHWTLITRSGTIGRMAYVRPDMVGLACSEDVLRVIPDASRIPPGYLYAFLSSRYGVPLVVSGTYGAIIQHIEPEHISDLPVPRFEADAELRVHTLVELAARKRSDADCTLTHAITDLLCALHLPKLLPTSSPTPFSTASVQASCLQSRFDGFFHSRYHSEAVSSIASNGASAERLSDIASSIEEPKRFKRVPLNPGSGAVPMFGTSAIFWSDPEPLYYLPNKMAAPYVVTRKTLLIPRSGQISGVIGHPVLAYGQIIGGAVSEDAIRIHCKSEVDAGFLFVFLSSEYGIRQLKARAFGASIPHLDVRQIGNCFIPKAPEDLWVSIGRQGLAVSELRGEAIGLEREARRIVERAISGEEM